MLEYNQPILQVRYRSLRNHLVVFFAKTVETDVDQSLFGDCRVPRTISSRQTGLTEIYAEKFVADIPIPNELDPVVTEGETPVWWDTTRDQAIKKLGEMEKVPMAVAIGQKLAPGRNNLYLHLRELSDRDLAEFQSVVMTGQPLKEDLARKFGEA